MLEQISTFFTIEMIYMWMNIGVLPIWFIIIFLPNSNICRFFALSIIPFLIFASAFSFLIYNFFNIGYNFLNNFSLYLGIKELKELFKNDSFIIVFWIHFLAINLFCGSWIVNDAQKLMISKYLVFLPVVLTYFVGPLGIVLYWLIRIFYAKNVKLLE